MFDLEEEEEEKICNNSAIPLMALMHIFFFSRGATAAIKSRSQWKHFVCGKREVVCHAIREKKGGREETQL